MQPQNPSTNEANLPAQYETASRSSDSRDARPSSKRLDWFLCGRLSEKDSVREFPIHSEVFTIGRNSDCSLSLPLSCVSGRHAQIQMQSQCNGLLLRDLDSTNGTFVNGKKMTGEVLVGEGDLLQFATLVFRVGIAHKSVDSQTVTADSHDRALAMMQFDRLISDGGVLPFFQPLVRLEDRSVFGYEVLGRSRLFGLQTPKSMFQAAGQLDLEAELSEVFRDQGVVKGRKLPRDLQFFVNTHPKELGHPRLAESLKEMRDLDPEREIVLEIHEGASTDLQMMKELRKTLTDLGIGLAFDDFGVGHARLVELSEVRPDFLKFDMKLTQNIEKAPARRQEGVALFAKLVNDLGIKTLAEGVETEACHNVLTEMGFEFGQGFLYGKPASVTRYLPQSGN